jgi:hypothetical protein
MDEPEDPASLVTNPEVEAQLDAQRGLLIAIRGQYINQALMYESLVEDIIASYFAPDRESLFKAVMFEDITMQPKVRMLKRVMQDLGVEGEFEGLRKGLTECMEFRNVLAHGQVILKFGKLARSDAVTFGVYDDDDGGERRVTLTEEDVSNRIRSEGFITDGLLKLGRMIDAMTTPST